MTQHWQEDDKKEQLYMKRYTEYLNVRMPVTLAGQLQEVTRFMNTNESDYVRRALTICLKKDLHTIRQTDFGSDPFFVS